MATAHKKTNKYFLINGKSKTIIAIMFSGFFAKQNEQPQRAALFHINLLTYYIITLAHVIGSDDNAGSIAL
jgi:hypothetical protein